MTRLGGLGLAVLLASAGPASAGDGEMRLAWQMGTTERGYTENFGENPGQGADTDQRFGSRIQSDPFSQDSRGSYHDDPLRRPPNLGGDQGGPYFRPGTGRDCTGQGSGRTCF